MELPPWSPKKIFRALDTRSDVKSSVQPTVPSVFHLTRTHIGGGGVYAQRLSDALCAAGQTSEVLSAEDGTLQRQGRVAALFDRVLKGILNRCAVESMHSFLRRARFKPRTPLRRGDALHLHSITGFIGSRGLRCLAPAGAKIFWTAHNPWLFTGGCVLYAGCDHFESNCAGCPILPVALRPWARAEFDAKRRFARERHVQPIANSEWMASLMRRSSIYGSCDDIPVVPPIVDAQFRPRADGDDLRAQLRIAKERFVIGLSSRAVTDTAKGIGKFFASLPDGWQPLSRVTFLVLGDGRISLPPSVDYRFTGHVSGEANLARHYSSMDLFLSPSSMETFGMALLEAQACGTPVVAFDTGGTPEAVCPEPSCKLVPNGDFASMLRAVESATSAGTVCEVDAEKLSRWVTSRHSAAVIAAKQIAVYRQHGLN
jgi:glycosyltransferase involved in cell wall biosynthesis